ncbi:3-phosphoshikimate 1-carboxyvinyltransferase [SAR86 cluster bacterium]|nr:3-phosphoshikimate 1-carboxyvinyltransferase [SAR86 cluster bacterium]
MNLSAKYSACLKGELLCPGDKSISQRVLIIGSFLNQEILISNILASSDPICTANALNQVNANLTFNKLSNTVKTVKRQMPFQDPTESLDLGNSGTGARLLTGFLSGLGINATITGDKSLSSRPMKRIVEPLTKMGFKLNSNNHRLPIEITQSIGSSFFEYNSPISSAQVKSSILLAALTGSIETKITEPIGSRDHTERMLKYFGADIHSEIKNEKNIIHFSPSDLSIQDENYYVVGDFSSAAFLIVAALISEDSEIIIRDVGINPTRAALINVLKEMGGNIEFTKVKQVSNEEVCNILVKNSQLKGADIGGDIIPSLIDEIPILSIAASFADGKSKISDIGELRVKESDRLNAISKGLDAIGIKNCTDNTSITIEGKTGYIEQIDNIKSFDDHRIAMSFLVAGLRSKRGIIVNNCENIVTSYPNFVSDMNQLGSRIDEVK